MSQGTAVRVVGRRPSRAKRTKERGRCIPARMTLLLLLLTLFLSACGSDSEIPREGEATLDETPVYSLDPAATPAERVPGPVDEILGSEESPVESVRALAWTRDGEILLADAGRALLLLSADGDSLQVLGGSGEGPGEFQQTLMAGALSSGGVVHFDPVLNRVTEFSASHEVARLWNPEPALAPGSLFAPVALTSDGALLGVPLPAGPSGSRGSVRESPERDDSVLWRYATVLHVTESGVDTVTEVAIVRCRQDDDADAPGGGDAPEPECPPDGDMATMTSSRDEMVVAPRDRAEALVFGADLELRYSVRLDDPEAEPFSKVLRDDRGRLWLGHWSSPEWWVVQEGRASRIELPEGFDLWDVSHDRALGVVRGPLDTQRIGVLELPPARIPP